MDGTPQVMYATPRSEVARYVLWDRTGGLDYQGYLRAVIRAQQAGRRARLPLQRRRPAHDRKIGSFGSTPTTAAPGGYPLAGIAGTAARHGRCGKTRFAFEQLGLNRVEGQCDVHNPASGRVMAHAGMRYEGRLRERIFLKGEYADVRLYALLRRDWLALTGSE